MRLEELIGQDYKLVGHGRWLHGIQHDSLVVDVEKQKFYWNSIGVAGDMYIWLTKVKDLTHKEAISFLKTLPDYRGSFIINVNNQTEDVVYPDLVETFYSLGKTKPRDYWYSRGITDDTIDRFRLGITPENFYTIPIYMDGLFKNFQLRKDIPEKTIRSYYRGVGRLLFNSDLLKLTSSVIITEGPTDCIRLIQEGIPSVSHNAGSEGWMAEWFKYFIHQVKVYVVYDNDDAGRIGAKKVATHLGLYKTRIYTFDGFGPKYDVIDFFRDGHTSTEFIELIKEKSKLAFEV